MCVNYDIVMQVFRLAGRFSVFPEGLPVTRMEKQYCPAYGGGSAPDFNGIPYQALAGT